MKIVIAYIVLSILDMRYNSLGNLVSKFVEPVLDPISNTLGLDNMPAAIVLVIGLHFLKQRIGY